MRGLKGYIRRITDGLAPPPGSVVVHAVVQSDDAELDQTTHDLGVLTVDHLVGGSGSATLADADGTFGWQFELAPGKIDQEVVASDPVTEYHLRYPDESSQIGAAFHTDLERLGWAAGGDVMIWNAIAGGNDPSAVAWSNDPAVSWNMGNGSIAAFGTGADAGKVTLRPFISFVGGILFSVEGGDLVVPIGGPPGPPNGSGQDRWDLLYLVQNTDRASPEYGKQTIEIVPGTPGAGIPTPVDPTAQERRRAIHALKMVAGASVYSSAYDLRGWNRGTSSGGGGTVAAPPITETWAITTGQFQAIAAGQANIASALNTKLASEEVIIPPGVSYTGTVTWSGWVRLHKAAADEIQVLHVRVSTEGYGISGLVAGTDYVTNPEPAGMPLGLDVDSPNGKKFVTHSITFPITQIPGFDTSSQLSPLPRSWSRLRFKVSFSATEPPLGPQTEFRISRQSLMLSLTPVA